MRAAARWLAIAIAVPLALVLAAFGLLQTRIGQDWLAAAIARAASSPGFSLTIEGLRGTVPLRMTAARIEVGDDKGMWLTLRNVALDLAPAALLTGKVHVRSLDIADVDMRRSSSPRSSEPLSQSLRVPHLPVAVVLDRLTITRLTLMPAVLGEKVVATIKGSAAVESGTARADLDLHRTDGFPGNIAVQMALTGSNPVLDLQIKAEDPTGVLLDHWAGRTDRLPLALALDGKGPVADWHGQLAASAGAVARVDAEITLGVGSQTVLGISGIAALAALLPADLASAVGDRATFSLHTEFGRPIASRLAIGIAAGTLAADSSFDRSDGAIAAHLRADVPNLALLSGVARTPLHGSATLDVGITGRQNRPVAKADLSATGIGVSGSEAERVEVHVSATPTGPLDNAATRIAVAANGRIEGLALPERAALMTGLGRGIDWSLAADTDRDVTTVDLTRFAARSGGIDLTGSGRLATAGQTIAGQVDFAGSASGMRTGIAAIDALIGNKAAFAGTVRRDAAGAVTLDHVALAAAAAKLSGDAHFDPASHVLADVAEPRCAAAEAGRRGARHCSRRHGFGPGRGRGAARSAAAARQGRGSRHHRWRSGDRSLPAHRRDRRSVAAPRRWSTALFARLASMAVWRWRQS